MPCHVWSWASLKNFSVIPPMGTPYQLTRLQLFPQNSSPTHVPLCGPVLYWCDCTVGHSSANQSCESTLAPCPFFFQIKRYWNRATSTCLHTRWLFHAVAVVAVEIVWPTKPRFFIIWLLTEKKICQPSCTLFDSFVSGPFLPFNVRKGFKVTLLKIFQ